MGVLHGCDGFGYTVRIMKPTTDSIGWRDVHPPAHLRSLATRGSSVASTSMEGFCGCRCQPVHQPRAPASTFGASTELVPKLVLSASLSLMCFHSVCAVQILQWRPYAHTGASGFFVSSHREFDQICATDRRGHGHKFQFEILRPQDGRLME